MSEQTIKTTQNAYVPTDADFRLKDNAGKITIDTNFAAQSFWKDVTLRFFRKTSAWIGLFLIIIITVVWRLDDESTSTGAEGLPLVLLGG